MNSTAKLPKIILASTSPFRKALLQKLRLPFITENPAIDETPYPHESVVDMVNRLSLAKAHAVAEKHPNAIIIASDQSATYQGQAVGKPHTYPNAVQQLNQFSGETIHFNTGLVVFDNRTQKTYQTLDVTKVTFRTLSETDIHNYLILEEPYQCAGSFKSEGLGITLFSKIEGKDPNALIGLPLIDLTSFLKQCDIQLPFL
ncbi:MAG: septum formation inhibitor Maf [Hydrogenovibrio crunogenus]|uniref:7-methyl-GTP pyrophosphatase n=1 Tax=Hydrogenovibrio crunogenus (strain DSM 25203 / XCL-2) TaxID=317025 RepID=NTPPB_HYDCU|nr:RecName: Full=7-methyl-GTP pyrophosphatase; Short=m(7)GTP pyrophosphatase [Hydrogenovibrio crunogenus XCL-2]MBD3611018.1 septum formation inhibitor Maf [Hydrogenovibrio crunogenus]